MQAQALHNRIIELQKASSYGLLMVGECLYQLEQERGWEVLNFQDWTELVTTDIDAGGLEMDISDASKLKTVYQHYVVGGIASMEKLKELGGTPYKFYEARTVVKTPADLELLRLPGKEIKKIRTQGDKSISDLSACKHTKGKAWFHCSECDVWVPYDHEKHAVATVAIVK